MDKLVPITLPPGMRNTGTRYQSKNRWYTGNFVRFFQDTIQPIGGWTKRTLTGATVSAGSFVIGHTYAIATIGTTDFTAIGASANTVGVKFKATGAGTGTGLATVSIQGTPNAAIAWTVETTGYPQFPVIAIGTTSGLYVISSNTVYCITRPGTFTTVVADRVWHLDVFGSYLVATATCESDYTKTVGPIIWTGTLTTPATVLGEIAVTISGTPTILEVNPYYSLSVAATAERFLVSIGGTEPVTQLVDPPFVGVPPSLRTVYWASQEGYDTWWPKADNTAGSLLLATEGRLLCGRRSRNALLLWTTVDLWAMSYIGGDAIYRIEQVGNHCGAISGHACIVEDTAAYWMGVNGFYLFDGFVKPIPCDVHDYVFGGLNTSYFYKVWAVSNPRFGEITWFYPSALATDCDRYVTYNYRENHWTTGALSRTCGVTIQPPGSVPVLINASGEVFDHETGTSRNSEGTPYLESGPFELEDGDQTSAIQKIIPDDKTVGDVNLTIYTSMFPDELETTHGPYTLSKLTSVRLKARQARIRLTEVVANAWRVGVIRLGIVPSSRR